MDGYMTRLILASKSPFRAMLLNNAGVPFTAESARIDEREIERSLQAAGASPLTVALELAKAKALDVSVRRSDALVIGSDQTLSLGAKMFHKPDGMDDARRHLQALSGKTHQLNSGVALAQHGKILWEDVSIARLTMRRLSDAFIDRHLDRVGEQVLSSVGAYQYEGEGMQLFETIDGDYFAIVGLPVLPLLGELRKRGIIDG
jgi:septum formation protein